MNNRQWVLRSRPFDTPRLVDCFELLEAPLRAVEAGEVLLRNLAHYIAPMELGDPTRRWRRSPPARRSPLVPRRRH
jgi:hypothetical protein